MNWDNKEWLEAKYVGEGLSTTEIAEIVPVSRETVRQRLHEYDVRLESNGKDHSEKEYADKDTLYELYHNKGESVSDIAKRFGCDRKTIGRWLNRFDIPRKKENYVTYLYTDSHGYETVSSSSKSAERARIHRLAAVAWYGYDTVVEKDIHHKNGATWDNREDNIMPVTKSEHAKTHHAKGDL